MKLITEKNVLGKRHYKKLPKWAASPQRRTRTEAFRHSTWLLPVRALRRIRVQINFQISCCCLEYWQRTAAEAEHKEQSNQPDFQVEHQPCATPQLPPTLMEAVLDDPHFTKLSNFTTMNFGYTFDLMRPWTFKVARNGIFRKYLRYITTWPANLLLTMKYFSMFLWELPFEVIIFYAQAFHRYNLVQFLLHCDGSHLGWPTFHITTQLNCNEVWAYFGLISGGYMPLKWSPKTFSENIQDDWLFTKLSNFAAMTLGHTADLERPCAFKVAKKGIFRKHTRQLPIQVTNFLIVKSCSKWPPQE